MTVRSWLATCSSSTCTTVADTSTIPYPEKRPPSPKFFVSDTSSCSEIPGSCSSTSRDTSCSSLQSNLSLQTLPSVPSLQNLSPETLNLSISHLCVTSLKPRPVHVACLAVSGHLLYAASNNEINVYDLTTNYTHLDAFNGKDSSSGTVKSIVFCDGKVFTSHQNGKIRVWQVTATKRHKLLTTLPTVNDRLRRFILPKNYVNVRRHKKRLWIEHADAVSGLAVANGLICSVSWDKCFKIWRPSDLRCVQSVKAHEDAINAVAVSADGTLYTGSADRRIRVWAKPFGEKRHSLVATLEKHKSAVNALALNGDGSVLFSGACDRSILVWEREDSANHMVVTGALRGHTKAILCLINVSDLLLSGSADRTVRVWQRGQAGRYCCLAVLEGHRKPVKSLVAVPVSAGLISVFSGSFDGEIKVWQVSVSSLNSPSSTDTLK
ncbi:hypothetical protein L1049_005972 [Liquidambar formosana]|uniref:Uncharacterized protein n=1 Tax=Liquidambar formosana TaxID=63359 RepID=A0AAP0REM8_LIQFO